MLHVYMSAVGMPLSVQLTHDGGDHHSGHNGRLLASCLQMAHNRHILPLELVWSHQLCPNPITCQLQTEEMMAAFSPRGIYLQTIARRHLTSEKFRRDCSMDSCRVNRQPACKR